MLAIFENNPAFTVSSLTLALLRQPYVPGLVGRLNLFRPVRLATTTTMIEVQGTRLALVPEMPRGAPPTPNVEDRRAMVSVRVPHFPIRDTIYADSVQNVRAFGSEDALQGVTTVVNDREAGMGLKLDVTLEYLRLGAVKGVIVTAADRVTGAPLSQIDLFQQFGVQPQPVQEWPIGGAGRVAQERPAWAAQLTGLVNDLARAMADELPGGMLTRIRGRDYEIVQIDEDDLGELGYGLIGAEPVAVDDNNGIEPAAAMRRPGRPSRREEIERAFAAVEVDPAQPIARVFPAIRRQLTGNAAPAPGLGDRTLRKILGQLVGRRRATCS